MKFMPPYSGFVYVAIMFLGAGAIEAQQTGSSTVNMTLSPEASISITNASTALLATTAFANYSGATSFTYKIRTSASTGSGSIQLQVTTDFSPANGPSVAQPPTAGDKLTYTCVASAPAVSCSGVQTASTTLQTSIASFGSDAHSADNGNSGTVNWTLTNDPVYRASSYSAVVTFTISAT